tara:strand:- start:530 stop:1702 length:1173 start_codon:yes stop_codon:yes gene_type:complete
MLKYPLIKNNITREDLNKVISHLKLKDPILTQSKYVNLFERKWSKWLGVKYSVFVNSGSSANLISIAILKILNPKGGEILLPSLTWSSDVSSVLHCGFKPVFIDIDMNTLSMNNDEILKKISSKTKAVFLSHIQGFSGLTSNLLKVLKKRKIMLIEDVCESHGAKHNKKKLGTFGTISNFSFYYAHHMSTIEGGMVCTNDENIYQLARMLRGHGLLRESNNEILKKQYLRKYKNLNSDFIFTYPAFNMRNNEIGAIIGINQLKYLNKNILKRNKNHKIFLQNLNPKKFFTEFKLIGSSNYAFNLILKNKNKILFKNICSNLLKNNIEFRVGSAGGGNQLRQPYLKQFFDKNYYKKFPNTEHIHFFGMYIGNYPDLNIIDIVKICKIINES